MDPNELTTVYTVTDPTQAELIKHALLAEGIACELDGEQQAALTGLFDIGVMVRAQDADRARSIIASHESTR